MHAFLQRGQRRYGRAIGHRTAARIPAPIVEHAKSAVEISCAPRTRKPPQAHQSTIRKKHAPDLIRGRNQFSDGSMLHRNYAAAPQSILARSCSINRVPDSVWASFEGRLAVEHTQWFAQPAIGLCASPNTSSAAA